MLTYLFTVANMTANLISHNFFFKKYSVRKSAKEEDTK